MGTILEDFNKLHVTLRSFVISVVLLTPFWYFDLYLFKKEFVSHDYIECIPVVSAFCLSLIWIAANALSGWFFVIVMQGNNDSANETNVMFSVVTTVFSVLHLSLYTYIGYLCKLSFFWFLNYTYILVLIRVLVWFVFFVRKSDDNKRE